MYGYEYQILFGGRMPEDLDTVLGEGSELPMDEHGNPAGPAGDGRSFAGPLGSLSTLFSAS